MDINDVGDGDDVEVMGMMMMMPDDGDDGDGDHNDRLSVHGDEGDASSWEWLCERGSRRRLGGPTCCKRNSDGDGEDHQEDDELFLEEV